MAKIVAVLFVALFGISMAMGQLGLKTMTDMSVMRMPSMVMMGDVVTMECNMDTQGAKVMWMKWMKDGQEIMMMEPNKAPITKDVEGVTLDLNECRMDKLVMKNINSKSSGMYMCELMMMQPAMMSETMKMAGSMAVISKN